MNSTDAKDDGVGTLPDETYNHIQTLCSQGNALAEGGNYPIALERYWAAWDQLPEPQADWEAATWILGAVGDSNFLGGDFAAGRDNLTMAMHCPNAIGNPFLHLRLGQCQYELGNLERAADELAKAYMGGGAEMFEDAQQYFAFLKTRLRPPPGGW